MSDQQQNYWWQHLAAGQGQQFASGGLSSAGLAGLYGAPQLNGQMGSWAAQDFSNAHSMQGAHNWGQQPPFNEPLVALKDCAGCGAPGVRGEQKCSYCGREH